MPKTIRDDGEIGSETGNLVSALQMAIESDIPEWIQEAQTDILALAGRQGFLQALEKFFNNAPEAVGTIKLALRRSKEREP